MNTRLEILTTKANYGTFVDNTSTLLHSEDESKVDKTAKLRFSNMNLPPLKPWDPRERPIDEAARNEHIEQETDEKPSISYRRSAAKATDSEDEDNSLPLSLPKSPTNPKSSPYRYAEYDQGYISDS
jgi:hypothetical protein